MGYSSKILRNARIVNESISNFIVENIIRKIKDKNINLAEAKVKILGITFKENINDIRNSKVINIIKGLKESGIKTIYVEDKNVNLEEVAQEYNLEIESDTNNEKVDVLVIAVAHKEYKKMTIEDIINKVNKNKIVFDIKNIFNKEELLKEEIDYWSL